MKVLLFVFVIFMGMMIGGMMATYLFFGILTLVGLIALVESVRPLKWLFERTTSFIDIIIFILTVMATVQLGVTITASLTVAGLGFTLLYSPYLRQRYKSTKIN